MVKAENWIKGAVKKPGSFTREAQRAGMSVKAFTSKVLNNKKKYSTKTVRRASLARVFSKMK